MNILVVATKNKGKYLEFKKILGCTRFEMVSLSDFPHIKIHETGSSFDENALLKANAVVKNTGFPALADDSGLEVSALQGSPGIFTARYAGENATDEDNIKKLLSEMKDIPSNQRQARFVCSLALVFPDKKVFLERGILEGYITFKPRGIGGFGYDPIFFVPALGRTLSEVSIDDKNRISHRAKALEKIKRHFSYI
ncbi:MAG: XTP/dITP diphosphatase [Tepidanaerobacteraceae bacterium]|nr:XTP/dITP diphosphatase [Tepidanaerobacteraceae bacterium]